LERREFGITETHFSSKQTACPLWRVATPSACIRAGASAFEVSLRAVLKADALLGSPFFQTAQLRPATKGGTMMIAKTQT